MSNFKCDKCGMVNIDCGLGGFKTPREIELEECIKEIEQLVVACMFGYTDEFIQKIIEIIHKSEVMD